MDIATVLEIIKMIDAQIQSLYDDEVCANERVPIERQLSQFRDHLQSFIEGELNAAENQSTEQ